MNTTPHAKWVRFPYYLELTGETRSTWYKLKDEGEFFEGIHYKTDKAKRVWINTEAMEAWLLGSNVRRSNQHAA